MVAPGAAPTAAPAAASVGEAPKLLKSDVASATEQEAFEVGMRQDMMEMQAFDVDENYKLDFREYSKLVREREIGIHSELALQRRFDDLDVDGSHHIDMKEYVLWALRDALERSTSRVRDIFMNFDKDNSGSIEKREWRQAMRSLGVEAPDAVLDAVFAEFDIIAKDGAISYKELDKELRRRAPMPDKGFERDIAIEARKLHPLRRGTYVSGSRIHP